MSHKFKTKQVKKGTVKREVTKTKKKREREVTFFKVFKRIYQYMENGIKFYLQNDRKERTKEAAR